MFEVTFMVYDKSTADFYSQEFTTQLEARTFAKGLSLFANVLKWTRHCNITSLIETHNEYHDLFNEGSIVMKPKAKV